MKQQIYSINNEYSRITGLRTIDISEFSGEDFYHKVLNELFYNSICLHTKLIVDLDSGRGYAPSFVDEAFGNLVFDFSKELVDNFFELQSENNPSWYAFLESSKEKWERRRKNNDEPKKTITHLPWYRLVGTEYKKEQWSIKN